MNFKKLVLGCIEASKQASSFRPIQEKKQNLQVNIRWKALDEICKMYILLHRSDIKISAKSLHKFGNIELLVIKTQFIRIFAILALQLLFSF